MSNWSWCQVGFILVTLSSLARSVLGSMLLFTMSEVTGNFPGRSRHLVIILGLLPFRHWYPKKVSSFQCSMQYSDTNTHIQEVRTQ